MRVLHCIPSLAGGGAERQCVYLAGELARLGVEVHVAVAKYDRTEAVNQLAAVATIHLLGAGGGTDLKRTQRNWRLPFHLLGLMRSLQPDLVQTWNRPMDLYAGLAASLLGRPWILSERNAGALYTDLREHSRRWVARRAAAIVANSTGGDQYWAAYASRNTHREVIPNMLPLENIRRELAGEAGPKPSGGLPRLLYVGRFEPQKNIEVMMEGFCRAVAAAPGEVVLLGDGQLRGWAEQRVAERGLRGQFQFKGFTDPPWQEMGQASLLVLASRFEGHPNVVCEAMAAGCPVVLSDVPAHRALFKDSQAVFFDANNPADLARAIRLVLDHPEQTRQRVAAAGKLVSGWSPELIARRYLALYVKLNAARHPNA